MAPVPASPQTTITELPESRVRIELKVSAAEIEERVQRSAGKLGRDLKLPGFRKGKVPPTLVLQRLGWDAVLEEVVRESVGRWYLGAIEATGIVPVGDPQVDLGDLPPRGEELDLSIEVGVLPRATLGEYRGLEVPRREVTVEESLVAEEVERLRERLARLETAERPAQQGDYVVIDYEGSLQEGEDSAGKSSPTPTLDGRLSARDHPVELDASKLLPGFAEALIGAKRGEQRSVEVPFPEDHPESDLAGRTVAFELTLKEVKQRELPDLDEDFAIDVGFDDVDELQADIRARLAEAETERIDVEFREAALDAAVAQAQVQTPAALVQARAAEMWERMLHSLSHRGISREIYLQMDGRPEEQILTELASDAERALRREAVLTAIVAAERIEPSDEELLETLGPVALERETEPQKLLEELRSAERLEEVREDLAARRAIDLIVAEAKPIAPDLARAREKLWTPEGQAEGDQRSTDRPAGETAGGLWTPDR